MSAFIVEPGTMDRVIASLRRQPDGLYAPKELKVETQEDADRVGKALYRLNILAVAGRYEERPEYGPMFQYRAWPAASSRIEQYKAVSCLAYQCAEEATEHDPLRLALEGWRNQMANDIASDAIGYDKADWDHSRGEGGR
jgi:hypothetical protein